MEYNMESKNWKRRRRKKFFNPRVCQCSKKRHLRVVLWW